MTINLTGTVLSSILFEHSNSVCDKEGLLLGKISHITTDTISDSSLNNIECQTVYYLHSFVPCEKLFSWYNSKGQVQVESLKKILCNYAPENVIGWFKLRRNSSLTPSIRERAIHRHLEEWMKRYLRDGHLVFLLCSSYSSFEGALYTSDHQFMTLDGRKFQNMLVTVTNLGSIAKPNYQTSSNFTCSTDSSYSSVMNSLRSDFVNGTDELASVKKVETLKFHLQEKLKMLSEKLIRSDAEVGREMAEVKRLKAQLHTAEGFKASPAAVSTGPKSGSRGLCQIQRYDDVFVDADSMKNEGKYEEKHLITFEDDSDSEDDDTTQEHLTLTQRNTSASHDAGQTDLLHQNNEPMNSIQLIDDSDGEEIKMTTVKQADIRLATARNEDIDDKDTKQEKPFEFLDNIVEMHSAGNSSYALRNRSVLPHVEPDQRDVRRTTRKMHVPKQEQMDWETTSKNEIEGNLPRSSRRNVQKICEREEK